MTSIEWLESKLPTAFKELSINKELFKQAKEMHKKEIIDAFIDGNRQECYDATETLGDKYYIETFKQQ